MGRVNGFLISSLVVLGIAQVLAIVGVATPRWVEGQDFNDGLFRRCNTTSDKCGSPSSSGYWFVARSLLVESCIGIFFAILLLVLFIIMLVKDKMDRYRKCFSYKYPQFVLSSTITAAVVIAISLILIHVDVKDYNSYPKADFGYSFYIVVAACIILPAGGVLAFLGRIPKNSVDDLERSNSAMDEKIVVGNGSTVHAEETKSST